MIRLLFTFMAAATAFPAWADYTDTADSAATGLSKQLLCGVVSVGSGNIALLAGLMVALYGLWVMVRSGAFKSGIILVISGALLTALPSLIISGLDGTAALLQRAGISEYGDIDQVKQVAQLAGNCASIPVDFSAYASMPAWWQSAHNPGGAMNPTYNPSGRYVSGEGPINPNATTGSSGCTELVEGGQPGSPFGPRRSVQTSNGRMSSSNHKGVDVRCGGRSGPKIYASAGGTVFTQFNTGGYGNRAVIDHGGGRLTTYNHMSGFGPNVKTGTQISANDVVGYCGSTGNSTGPHLHFEYKKEGYFVDPVANGCGR